MTASPEPVLRYVSHDEFLRDIEALACAIAAAAWRADFLVGIGRGGLAPAVYLSHRIGTPMLSVDHSAKVSGFGDDLLVRLAELTGGGSGIVFVDDINDSGATIAAIRDRMSRLGAATDRVRYAVLIDNLRSCAHVDYRSRTIDRATEKDWFVFPWEAVAPRVTLVGEALAVPGRLG